MAATLMGSTITRSIVSIRCSISGVLGGGIFSNSMRRSKKRAIGAGNLPKATRFCIDFGLGLTGASAYGWAELEVDEGEPELLMEITAAKLCLPSSKEAVVAC